MSEKKQRLIVVGAGISGLSTGVFAQMNNFDSQIFEMHVLPGGCCTSWSRKGYIFDYCIDWLIGSGADNDANQLWRELGALDGKEVVDFDVFNRVQDPSGRAVTFYNDPDQLEKHLKELSPEDAEPIEEFCNDLRKLRKRMFYPFLKPMPMMTLREKLKMAWSLLPVLGMFRRAATTKMSEFSKRFKDPLLRQAFPNMFFQDPGTFPLLPYHYNIACASNRNAGFPQGGSLGLAKSVEERYKSLGGQISYRSRVAKILVENDRAIGVELEDGSKHYADVVIAACDGLTTIYKMLDGKYRDKTIETLYDDMLNRPGYIFPGVMATFVGVDGQFAADEPHCTTYLLDDDNAERLPGALQKSFVVQHRSQYSAEFAPPGKSVLYCSYFSDFNYWHNLRTNDRRAYRAEKRKVAEFTRRFLEQRYPGISEKIEIMDVASPATMARYTGNHRGSILAWQAFTDADDILTNTMVNKNRMQLPGLKNFYMAGQWVALGGLVRAAGSGRFVMQYVCKDMGKKFRAWESQTAAPWQTEKLNGLPLLDEDDWAAAADVTAA